MVATDITTFFIYSETHYNTHFTTLLVVNFTIIVTNSDHNIQSCTPLGSNQIFRMKTLNRVNDITYG